MMSKKHYSMIAKEIREMVELDGADPCVKATLYQLADRLADKFKEDNPQFSKDRFMVAVVQLRSARPLPVAEVEEI